MSGLGRGNGSGLKGQADLSSHVYDLGGGSCAPRALTSAAAAWGQKLLSCLVVRINWVGGPVYSRCSMDGSPLRMVECSSRVTGRWGGPGGWHRSTRSQGGQGPSSGSVCVCVCEGVTRSSLAQGQGSLWSGGGVWGSPDLLWTQLPEGPGPGQLLMTLESGPLRL